jgi:hypothetical protein
VRPSLASFRAEVDDRGVSQILHQTLAATIDPQGIAHMLPACLDAGVAELAQQLQELLATKGKGLLTLPGQEQDGEAFVHAWSEELSRRVRADS